MSTLLKSAGLAEAMMKHISNLLILLVFSEEMEDRQLVMHFLKGISKLLASK